MAWRKRRSVDITTSLPTGVPTYSKISSMVKQIINASQYDYHETESFEVTEVILNESGLRGSVKGTFINNPNQEILGGIVKPLMPNITTVPVVGEHVVVTEYNGQHYYTSIINRKGSVNENSIPGAAGTYKKNTKYGEKFKRKGVQPILINEGDIVFEGRYGQSIKFGSNKQKPQIKIVAGHRSTNGEENINIDDSSIYLSGAGKNSKDGTKKVQIKSDDIFITGRKNLYLEADEISINAKKGQTIKMGDPRAPMVPTIRGDVMLKFQSDILTLFSDIQQILILLIANPAVFVAKAKALVDKIVRLTEVITKQTFLNKQVMTANPDFKLPKLPEVDLPKVPTVEIPELPKYEIPKIPEIPEIEVPSIEKLSIEEQLKDLKKS